MNNIISSNLLEALEESQSPRVILIRHADRYHIEQGDVGEKVELTPKGKRRAQYLGDYLEDELHWALASPLKRCVDTAILMGIEEPLSCELLGEPGPFVVDREGCAELFSKFPTEWVVREYINGREWPCMRSLEDGVFLLLEKVRSHLLQTNRSGVAVSHDSILMPVISWVTGYNFQDDWLAPLDGLIITSNKIFWGKKSYKVAKK